MACVAEGSGSPRAGRRLWVLGATLVALVVVMLIADLLGNRTVVYRSPDPPALYQDVDWAIGTSTYPGHISVVNPKGQHVWSTAPGSQATPAGAAIVRAGGRDAAHTTPGAYPVTGPDGKLLATVVLHRPGASPGERLRDTSRVGPEKPWAGMEGNGLGWIAGFDEDFGLTFTVSGATSCQVRFVDSRGGPQVNGYDLHDHRKSPPPTVEWTIGGKTAHRTGYGDYVVSTPDGKTATTLRITPYLGWD